MRSRHWCTTVRERNNAGNKRIKIVGECNWQHIEEFKLYLRYYTSSCCSQKTPSCMVCRVWNLQAFSEECNRIERIWFKDRYNGIWILRTKYHPSIFPHALFFYIFTVWKRCQVTCHVTCIFPREGFFKKLNKFQWSEFGRIFLFHTHLYMYLYNMTGYVSLERAVYIPTNFPVRKVRRKRKREKKRGKHSRYLSTPWKVYLNE